MLVARIWGTVIAAGIALRREGLPSVVERFARPPARGARRMPAQKLSRAVSRALALGPWRPRCLLRSLALYRLLRAQGDLAQLVIGLPRDSHTSDAHAWVELDGQDVGPAPGRLNSEELVRYPA